MFEAPSLEIRRRFCEPPEQPVVMFQRWQELVFLHWKMEPEVVQRSLPEGLFVDTFDGVAWVAVVPFEMRGIRPRWCLPVPGISDFLELNLRTYVYDAQGRPGVWFYSLDCDQSLAVWAARSFFRLPYFRAEMSRQRDAEGRVGYTSQRRGDLHESAFRYRLGEETRVAEPGSLDYFLVERYLLFSETAAGLRTGRVHHQPYPVVEVELEAWDAQLFALAGLPMPDRAPDHVCGSRGVDVRVYPLRA